MEPFRGVARGIAALLVLMGTGVGRPASAGLVILPSEIEPGGTFQLAFVTSGLTPAMSGDVAFYNAFVQSAARAAGVDEVNGQQVEWTAVVSTATVDARDNAPQTDPVFNLLGQMVATEPGSLWNTRLDFLDNPINVTEKGQVLDWGFVWTGTEEEGRSRPSFPLGSRFTAGVGDLSSLFTTWLSASVMTPNTPLRLYALSTPIRAEMVQAVPEPGSMLMLGSGLVAVAAARGGRPGRFGARGRRRANPHTIPRDHDVGGKGRDRGPGGCGGCSSR